MAGLVSFVLDDLPSLRFGLYTYFVYPGSDKMISGRGVTNGDSSDLGSLSSDHDHEKSHAVGALGEDRGARTWPSSDSIHASAVCLQPQGLLYRWSLVEGGCRQCWALGSIPSVPVCSPPASGLRGEPVLLLLCLCST